MKILSNAVGWFTGHARLVIEYVLIGLLVSVSGYALWSWGHANQQDVKIAAMSGTLDARAQVIDTLVQTNVDQDNAIAALKDLRERDAKAIAGLQKDKAYAASDRRSWAAKLEQLEKSNALAKKLLDIAVPADTSCVLDRRPCAAASSNPNNR